jgi:hypothetical protein
MANFLKGHYELPNKPGAAPLTEPDEPAVESLTERFEQSALAKLGGSVCFVVKDKTLLWTGETSEETG